MIKKKPVVIIALLMVLVLSLCACEPDFVGNKYKTKNKYVLSFSALILLNDKLPFASSPVTHILHRPSLSATTVNFPLLSPFHL